MSSGEGHTHSNGNGSRISRDSSPDNKNNDNRIKRKSAASLMTMTTSQVVSTNQVSNEVPKNRRQEIYEYMSLFGYKPDRTIIQVHITGFFRKKTYSQSQIEQHKAAVKRYGGTTFVVIGRTHDPSIMDIVTKPKQKSPYDVSPGYIGYLWKNKESQRRAPHEVIPLDFTPVHLPYPADWKNRFATKGFMIALHVPSSLAKSKNRLTRALYRIAKTRVDVKKEWKFLNELKNLKYVQEEQYIVNSNNREMQNVGIHARASDDRIIKGRGKNLRSQDRDISDPLHILKMRLAKGEITKNEYNELYNAISS
jgi:hypothetical protein